MKFEIIEHEVWGNEKDGYWVNNFHTGHFIELSEADLNNDKKLKRIVKKALFIKDNIRHSSIEIEGNPEYQLDVDVKGYPVGQLERVWEERPKV
jgi:hypothetical protein